ncbi:MAG TPA: hypothetical protein DDW81_14180 [Cryomorphaceae bacterium]|nr:hypothetical protein [Owenweeksia sp.]HBF21245.1 hypothetical protein [Cryomorphaceae bacterium]|tara:strand:- start:1967 stop:2614 length:648 start_codon:yes stop_codon:yes gene_type:complete
MKNALQKCIALLTLALIITSCSQTQDLAQNDGPNYRYKKVYVGNKIVYRDVEDQEATEETTEAVTEVSGQKNLEPVNTAQEEESLTVTASAETQETETADNRSFMKEVGQTFANNLRQTRKYIATGSFLTELSKQKQSERLSVTDASEEDDNTMMGAYEIFAILGFAFGIVSLFGGLIFAILGVIFSILGLNSGYRLFATIGLICAIVGFVLALL